MSGPEPALLRCESCGLGVHPEEALHDARADENVCPRCFDERMASYAERDWDRAHAAYYGGDGPKTLDEICAEARKLK